MVTQHAVGVQPLVEQRRVGQHAQRHRRVDGGLKLEEQDQVEPAVVAEANAPHEVAVALLKVFADEAGRQGGQGIEVEGAAPAPGGEAVEQVADHPRAREQQLVGGVVHSAPS